MKKLKTTLLVITILILSSCSTNRIKSGVVEGLYRKTHPNPKQSNDQIKFGYTEKECNSLEKRCNKYEFHEQRSMQGDNYYCYCIY